MPYSEPLPEWNAPGVEPSEDLKTNGWQAAQRPPASYFNWIHFVTYWALKELQAHAIHDERLYSDVNSTDTSKVATAAAAKKAYDQAVATLTAAKNYADTQIAALVNSAPGTLDTLNELAQALGDDPNFAASMTTLIGQKIPNDQKGVANGVATLDSNGKMTATQQQAASISAAGSVQLSSATNSSDETKAATPKAINLVAIDVGVKANLQTTAKTDLVAAINELFQSASNGKQSIATAIGAPTVSSDTFTKMASDIQSVKDNLVTYLTGKGETAAGTDPLDQLVSQANALNP
jgi:hypothetical protein